MNDKRHIKKHSKARVGFALSILFLLLTGCGARVGVPPQSREMGMSTEPDASGPDPSALVNPGPVGLEPASQGQAAASPEAADGPLPQAGGADDGGRAAYGEYIDSLKYLDEIADRVHDADSTIGMIETLAEARDGWDGALNQMYTRLMARLSEEQAGTLKATQRSWMAERDQLADRYSQDSKGGTLERVEHVYALLQCTKQRTLELASIYFNNSSDFSFRLPDLDGEGGGEGQGQSLPTTGQVSFEQYGISEKYYVGKESYVELDLKLPRLTGGYAGIAAINAYFAEKQQFFYAQLPLDVLAYRNSKDPIEGKADGYFVSAHYYLETQRGDMISIPAVLDGGAGGVSWVGLEGNTFDLNTGERVSLADLFRVGEEEYLGWIYGFVADEVAKRMREGSAGYGFTDAYSGIGAERIRGYNQDHFIVAQDALIVFYPKYDLADGASGVQEFAIPYGLLKDIMVQ